MARRDKASRQSRPPAAPFSQDAITPPGVNKPSHESSQAQPRPRAGWRAAYVLVPVALAFLTSANTLFNGFASDDQQQVLNSPFIKDFSNLPEAFTTSVWTFGSTDIKYAVDSFYRPIFNVLFTVNYALFGTSPWGWHLTNVLIHCAVTLLVFLTLSEFTGKKWVALTASALFAVHPAHAESIAWISGVTDPLMSLFLLPTFYCYLLYHRTGRKYLLGVAALTYLLGLLSKETAIGMPLIIAYCELIHFKGGATLRRRLLSLAAMGGLFAVPTLIYFLLRYNALNKLLFGGEPIYPLGYVFKSIPLVVVKYLKLMLIPSGYSYQHLTEFVGSVASVKFIAPLALIAAIAAAVILAGSRWLKFSAAWFIVWLAPALAILRQYDQEYLVQERYLYLPSMGFCLALALGIEYVARRNLFKLSGQRAAIAATTVLVLVWSVVNVLQNRVWKNNITLYQNCVAVEPRSAQARAALALAYFELGRASEAESLARAAIEIDPQYLGAYMNLSYQAHRLGRTPEAVQMIERGITATPESPLTRNKLATAYLNLGLLYSQLKQPARAESNIHRSIEMWARPAAWFHAGEFYFTQGRFEEAASMFELTERHISRNFAPIYLSLASTYERLNQRDKARSAYQQYLAVASPGTTDYSNVVRRLSQL
jgi:tetratricopeptide (TPR) repeat protein